MHRRLVYIYLLNVPCFSSRFFNKIKRTSHLGRMLALSQEILRSWDCKQCNLPDQTALWNSLVIEQSGLGIKCLLMAARVNTDAFRHLPYFPAKISARANGGHLSIK